MIDTWIEACIEGSKKLKGAIFKLSALSDACVANWNHVWIDAIIGELTDFVGLFTLLYFIDFTRMYC